jgi:hypothetical protein
VRELVGVPRLDVLGAGQVVLVDLFRSVGGSIAPTISVARAVSVRITPVGRALLSPGAVIMSVVVLGVCEGLVEQGA